MALMSDDIAGQDNVITELRLYNEIVYQICTHYDAFEAGLTQNEMQEALDRITEAVNAADVTDNPISKGTERKYSGCCRSWRKADSGNVCGKCGNTF